MRKTENSKKILVIPHGIALAHVSRPIQIAKALRDMGHELTFACSGKFAAIITEAGFELHPLITEDQETALARVRKHDLSGALEMLERYIEEERQIIRCVSPDIVLGDYRLSLKISTKMMHVPYVSINNATWTTYCDPKDYLPKNFPLTKVVGKRLSSMIFSLAHKYFLWFHARPFNRYTKRMGLSSVGNIFNILESKELNLLADVPEYVPTKNLPSHFNYIGPIMWEPEGLDSRWLNELDPRRPILYFTMGSTGFSKFFDQAFRLFANTNYQIVMATAGLTGFSKIPANFWVRNLVPGSLVLEKSKLVICHGGNGTIYQALSKGVPIIGIPTHIDQEFNMTRVVDLGLGLRIDQKKLSPSVLIDAVEKILTNQSYFDRAGEFQAIIARYNAPRKGAELIDRFLKGWRP